MKLHHQQNRQRGKNNCGHRMNQRCKEVTELVFMIQRACLCPKSSATNDDRHMRMTDKDTPQLTGRREVFADCAPQLFVRLRTRFEISHVSYMGSPDLHQILGNVLLDCLSRFHMFESSSKSGAVSFCSHDRKYLIETCLEQEKSCLLCIRPQYHSHCLANRRRCRRHVRGLHEIRMRKNAVSQMMGFVVVTGVFAMTSKDARGV